MSTRRYWNSLHWITRKLSGRWQNLRC